MPTQDIVRLTRRRVKELLSSRERSQRSEEYIGRNRRKLPRWPFPGAVELWPVMSDGRDCRYATCNDLNCDGIGILADQPFTAGTLLELACHFPEVSLYGQARVCHCNEIATGFLVGLQFVFED